MSVQSREYGGRIAILAYALLVMGLLVFLRLQYVNWARNDDFIFIDWYEHLFVKQDFSFLDFLAIRDQSHPLAFQALVSSLIFAVGGVNFSNLVTVGHLFLVMGAALMALAVSARLISPLCQGLAWILLLAVYFHPVQTDFLLWAFEFGWFVINAMLALSLYCVEIKGSKAYPLAVAACLIAAFSSAHGSVLWLSTAVHIFLKRDQGSRLWGASFLIAAAVNFLILARLTPPDPTGLSLATLPEFLLYFIQIIGAVSGQKDPQLLLVAGGILLSMLVLSIILQIRRHRLTPLDRMSDVAILAALVGTALFARGRFHFGLQWAIASFHMAPILMPCLAGLIIVSLQAFDQIKIQWGQKKPDRVANLMQYPLATLPCLAVVLSLISSLPFARFQSGVLAQQASIGRYFGCQEHPSRYILENSNIGEGYYDYILTRLPWMRPLCVVTPLTSIQGLVHFPDRFEAMIRQNPAAADPLHDAWEVYQTHFDLSRAFPPADPATPSRLLAFFRNSALTGSGYATDKMKRHQEFFLALPEQ